MKSNRRFILPFCSFIFFIGCKPRVVKTGDGQIKLEASDKIKSIALKKNDSVTVYIGLDSVFSISSIVEYKKDILNGEAMKFYPNGRLYRKVSNSNGVINGHTHYFYESGALKSEVFYHEYMTPYSYAIEYWDNAHSVPKYVFYYKNRNVVDTIRVFDMEGRFLRDSIPPLNSRYPKEL